MRIPAAAVNATRALHRERVSRGYLCAVAAATLLLVLDTAVYSHLHASFTGVLLVLLTLPWTPMLWALFATAGPMDTGATAYGWSGWTLTVVAALVSAVINAALLGRAARLLRRRVPTR